MGGGEERGPHHHVRTCPKAMEAMAPGGRREVETTVGRVGVAGWAWQLTSGVPAHPRQIPGQPLSCVGEVPFHLLHHLGGGGGGGGYITPSTIIFSC